MSRVPTDARAPLGLQIPASLPTSATLTFHECQEVVASITSSPQWDLFKFECEELPALSSSLVLSSLGINPTSQENLQKIVSDLNKPDMLAFGPTSRVWDLFKPNELAATKHPWNITKISDMLWEADRSQRANASNPFTHPPPAWEQLQEKFVQISSQVIFDHDLSSFKDKTGREQAFMCDRNQFRDLVRNQVEGALVLLRISEGLRSPVTATQLHGMRCLVNWVRVIDLMIVYLYRENQAVQLFLSSPSSKAGGALSPSNGKAWVNSLRKIAGLRTDKDQGAPDAAIPTVAYSSGVINETFVSESKLMEVLECIKMYEASCNDDPTDEQRRLLVEMYGFAANLGTRIQGNSTKAIEQRLYSILKQFLVFNQRISSGNVGLKNIVKNIQGFKEVLGQAREDFAAMYKRDFDLAMSELKACFQRIHTEIFTLLSSMMDLPSSYELMSLGSLATDTGTPYSDIEYVILVESIAADSIVKLSNFAEGVELVFIALGESSLSELAMLHLAAFKHLFNAGVLGARLDDHKEPNDKNRFVILINTAEGFLSWLGNPADVIHEPGNHLTSALFTPHHLFGNRSLLDDYQDRLRLWLSTKPTFRKVLRSLLEQTRRDCIFAIPPLAKTGRTSRLNRRVNMKDFLIQLIHIPRLLTLYRIACGDADLPLPRLIQPMLERLVERQIFTQAMVASITECIHLLLRLRIDYQIQRDSADSPTESLDEFHRVVGDSNVNKLSQTLQMLVDAVTELEERRAVSP